MEKVEREKLFVVKVGGKVVEDEANLRNFVDDFQAIKCRKVLVHGGGVLATDVAGKLGIKTRMVQGRRVTGDDMIRIVTMVYGGLVNKRLVALLASKGVNALGLTGADMNLVLSRKRPVRDGIDYGWVGDIKEVNAEGLSVIVESGTVPVMAALTHDGKGHILNTNADDIASQVARALSALYDVTLVYCFEKRGVLMNEQDDDSVIPVLRNTAYSELKATGIIQGGMIPKLDNAFAAIDDGVHEVVITNVAGLADLTQGTHIV